MQNKFNKHAFFETSEILLYLKLRLCKDDPVLGNKTFFA